MFHKVFFSDADGFWFDDGCECQAVMDDRGWHEACCSQGADGKMDATKCPWFREDQ
jgi:hypothetical protein